ncbi:unnamed protein product [Phytomonas sp. Hart1]|nr:unnamed protein product [Phytomonas sp. Hart1]|eukprot:CCW70894.1 unnamed protein product [Phytomonas sp. isolate Hart1]
MNSLYATMLMPMGSVTYHLLFMINSSLFNILDFHHLTYIQLFFFFGCGQKGFLNIFLVVVVCLTGYFFEGKNPLYIYIYIYLLLLLLLNIDSLLLNIYKNI